MIKNFICSISFLFLICRCFAQGDQLEIVKKFSTTPREDLDVQGFETDHTSGANYYNGEYNFALSLASIDGVQLDYNLSLSYSSAVKVADRGGAAGFGWTVGLPGSISREVNGYSDFASGGVKGILAGSGYQSDGYVNLPTGLYSNSEVEYGCPIFTYEHPYGVSPYTHAYPEESYFIPYDFIDLERDVYTLSVPGFSCHFYFINHDQIKIIEDVNFKIIQLPNSEGHNNQGVSSWIVQLDNGNKYYFGLTRESRSYSYNSSSGLYNPAIHQTVAWNLTKIEGRNGEVMEFIYANNVISETSLASSSAKFISNSMLANYILGLPFQLEFSRLLCANYYLNNVLKEKVSLDYSTNRIDGDYPYELTSVSKEVRNLLGDLVFVGSYNLDYEFASNRLWLKKIIKFSSSNAAFPPYEFNYLNLNEYPALESNARDFYGFYNGRNENSTLISGHTLSGGVISFPSVTQEFEPADRRVYSEFVTMGNLNSIRTPLGAEIQIEYEPGLNNIGSRVSKTKLCDADVGQCQIAHYKYVGDLATNVPSGIQMRVPVYTTSSGSIEHYQQGLNYSHIPVLSTIHSASSFNGVSSSASGESIGYTVVYVQYGEDGTEGQERYEFINISDQQSSAQSSGFSTIMGTDATPRMKIPISTNELVNGALISKTIYRKDDSNIFQPHLVYINHYASRTVQTTGTILTNLSGALTSSPGWGCPNSGAVAQWCNCLFYERYFKSHKLVSSQSKFIDEVGTELLITESYNYAYGGKLVSKISYIRDSPIEEVNYSYYPFASVIGSMQPWTLMSDLYILPAAKTINREGNCIAREKSEYGIDGNVMAIYKWNPDYQENNHLEMFTSFEYQNNLPSEILRQGNSVESNLYKGELLQAKIIGCKRNEVLIDNFDAPESNFSTSINNEISFLGLGCLNSSGLRKFEITNVKNGENYCLQFAYLSHYGLQVDFQIVDQNNEDEVYNEGEVGSCPSKMNWGLKSFVIPIESIDMVNKKLLIVISTNSEQGSFNIDELRIFPINSSVETYNYDNLNRLVSKLDWNFRCESYEFDDFDNLIITRDFEDHIIKRTTTKLKLAGNE